MFADFLLLILDFIALAHTLIALSHLKGQCFVCVHAGKRLKFLYKSKI